MITLMLQSAVQAFTAFVVTVINSVPHHKVLILVDCFGLFWLVPFYAHMHTNKHTTQINSICLLHMNTDYHSFIAGVFFYGWFLLLCPGTDSSLALLPITKWEWHYSSPTGNHASPLHIHIRIPVKPASAVHFKWWRRETLDWSKTSFSCLCCIHMLGTNWMQLIYSWLTIKQKCCNPSLIIQNHCFHGNSTPFVFFKVKLKWEIHKTFQV